MMKKAVLKKHSRHVALLTAIVLAFSSVGSCMTVSFADEITSESGSGSGSEEGSSSGSEGSSSSGSESESGSSSSSGSESGGSSSGSGSEGSSSSGSGSEEGSSSGSGSEEGSSSGSGSESGDSSGSGTESGGSSGSGTEGEGETGSGTEGEGETGSGTEGEGETGSGTEGEGETGSGTEGEGETGSGTEGEGETGSGAEGEGETGSGAEGGEEAGNEDESTAGEAAGGAGAANGPEVEKEKEFTVTYMVNPENAAIVEGESEVTEGEELVFTVEPQGGYVIQNVTANGYEVLAEANDAEADDTDVVTYVVSSVDDDLDIEVEMIEDGEVYNRIEALTTEVDGITIMVEPLEGELDTTVMSVSAVSIDSKDKEDAVKKRCAELGQESVKVKVFDITLLDENGEEVQPGCPVKVSFIGLDIANDEARIQSDLFEDISVFHVEDQEKELKINDLACEVDIDEDAVNFETNHFSVYAIAYPDMNDSGHRYTPTSYMTSTSTFEYKENSSSIIIDTSNSTLEEVKGGYDLTVDAIIAEDAEGPLTFVLSDAFLSAMHEFGKDEGIMPTYKFNLKLNLKNNSKNNYLYQADSLSVQTPESNVTTSFPGIDVTIPGFDGQIIDGNYGAYRVWNQGVKELFRKEKISFDDMLCIYDVLYENGYTGDYPLTDYYKDYYGTDDLSTVFSSISVESIGNNGTFDLGLGLDDVVAKYDGIYPLFDFANLTTSENKVKARIFEIEPELGGLLYNTFYQELFGLSFGKRVEYDTPLTMFMNHENSEWQDADLSFVNTFGDGLSTSESCDISMGMFFHPRMGNAYQGYNCSYYAAITLIPEGMTPDVPTPPTPPTPPDGGGSGGSGGGSTPGGHRVTPETNGPGITIEPEAVPLAPLPEITIPENEVPLAPLPKTGDSVMSQWICLMSGLLLGMYGLFGRKKEDF